MSTQETTRDVAPTALLQLVGHPVRWRLFGELARSDRMVQELAGLVGEPQSLVSYHLGKLRDARLVSAQQSSADRRDAYYTVDLARIGSLFSATGGALHPGLRLKEAPARVRSGGAVAAYSAGSNPKPLHPNALRVMRKEHSIDLSTHTPKHLNTFAEQRFDWVMSLCDQVREVCPELPGEPTTIHWSTRNPAPVSADTNTSYAAFRQTAAELEIRIGFLLAVLTDRPAESPQPNSHSEVQR